MKHSAVLISVLFVAFSLFAAGTDIKYPCKKLIEEGNYEKAEKTLNKRLEKDSTDYELYFAYSSLSACKDYYLYNNETAYNQLVRSYSLFNSLSEKELNKAIKNGYTKENFTECFQSVSETGLQKAKAQKTVEAYNHFLEFYAMCSPGQKQKATNERNSLIFAEIKQTNTIEAYNTFVLQYPDAAEVQEAIERRNKLAFDAAEAANTLEAYKSYIEAYPDAKQANKAWQYIYRIEYNNVLNINTEDAFRSYAGSYPKSPYSSDALLQADMHLMRASVDRKNWESCRRYYERPMLHQQIKDTLAAYIADIAVETQNIEAAKWVMLYLSGESRDRCWRVLKNAYLSTGRFYSLILFYKTYGTYAPEPDKTNDSLLLELYSKYNYYNTATTEDVISAAAPAYPAFCLMREQMTSYIKAKNWNAALGVINQYADVFGDNHYYQDLKRVIEETDDGKTRSVPLGPNINTKDGDEYAPAISADGKHLLFCAQKREDNIGGEDIFISDMIQGKWGKARLMSDVNTENKNEAPESLSADGTSMMIFKSGKLCMTRKERDGWTTAEPLPSNINISGWQADAMTTSDGKAMLFASKKQTEYELDESINIFVSLLQDDGSWGEPISLGPTINTPFTDRSPVLHPDMKTLYFSSSGHNTLGGLDVFMSTRLREDSWTEWSEPVNLGKLINTTENDCWYKISTDGNLAYFSKVVDGSQDIFQLTIPSHLRPAPVATVSGKLTDTKGQPIKATIRWEDLETGEAVGQSQTDPEDGSFFIVLPEGKNYGYYIDDSNLFPVADNIDLRTTNSLVAIENDITVATINEMIEEEKPMPLNNLFFNTGESELLPASITELQRVVEIIRSHPTNVEISGHTDNVGDDKSNMLLSDARAAAVKEYLVAQGIPEATLLTVGYGETRPVASNKTEEGRRKNRRVEIKFTKSITQ